MTVRLVGLDEHIFPQCQVLDRLPAILGRNPDAVVRLSDRWVSRFHCEIRRDRNGTLVVRDLSSKHGTFVNGRKVTESLLVPGDRLSVGLTSFLVERDAPDAFVPHGGLDRSVAQNTSSGTS
jgi:pSer/pThr/pTyr-binding forkhead associated (FHA) protein